MVALYDVIFTFRVSGDPTSGMAFEVGNEQAMPIYKAIARGQGNETTESTSTSNDKIQIEKQ